MTTISYDMDELLPLAAKLAAKYTSGESTSVPYETAGQLMEAVCYCIREDEREEGEEWETGEEDEIKVGREGGIKGGGQKCELRDKRKTAAESYRQGYEKVLAKSRRVQESYNALAENFQAYGNEIYEDTVLKALPGFFMKYDPGFAPQDTVIGMDYPTLQAVLEDTGIDAVERYIGFIVLEQRFLRKFPGEMVEEILRRFQTEYRSGVFNLCGVVLRHVLAAGLLGRPPGGGLSEEEYGELGRICADRDKKALAMILNRLTEKLVENGWGRDKKLLRYLREEIDNIAMELAEGAKWNSLQNVVV